MQTTLPSSVTAPRRAKPRWTDKHGMSAASGFASHHQKCNAFLQDCQGSPPALTLVGDQLEVVQKFNYLGSCVSALGIEDELTNRVATARSAFANLLHLWRRRDITLALKGRV
ncbi:unnamed protein product [Dicrocoelium dendriticum]|nr:unnamed protein product [Dicrocoelium dendriticum]